MKERPMNHRLSRTYAIAGLGLTVGLLALADWAFAQTAMHRNGFETKPGWSKGGADAPYDEIAHKIDDRDPHNGRRAEYIEIDAKKGSYIHYVYPVGKALISEESRATLWLRSNRPGMQIMA